MRAPLLLHRWRSAAPPAATANLPCPSGLLQPSGFPSLLFQEAAATANELSQRRRLDFAGREEAEAEGEGRGGLLASPRAGTSARRARQARELTGGAVAALLGGMAAGQLALRTHHVQAEPQLSAEEAVAVDSGGLQAHVAPLLVEVPVRATLAAPRHAVLAAGGSEGSAAGGERGGGTAAAAQAAAAAGEGEAAAEEAAGEVASQAAVAGAAAGEAPGPAESGGSGGGAAPAAAQALSSLKFTRQDLVLFQPALVAVSAEARAAAEAACRQAAASVAGIDGDAFDAALGALRSAGSAGTSRRHLRAALQGASGVANEAGQLLEQLLLHGLARAICGFEGRRYAAAEHSQCLLAFPHLPLPAAAEPPVSQPAQQMQQAEPSEEQLELWRDAFAQEVAQLASRLGLPPSGQLQPSLDVPVRPWVDHHGRLNGRLWEALIRKALAATARRPGGCWAASSQGRPGDGTARSVAPPGSQPRALAASLAAMAGRAARLVHHRAPAPRRKPACGLMQRASPPIPTSNPHHACPLSHSPHTSLAASSPPRPPPPPPRPGRGLFGGGAVCACPGARP